jgi:uncharacterized protein (TIGR02996 family)
MVYDETDLEAIRRNPDDDGPRLRVADRLDEQGQAVGRFIRAQCEQARRFPLPPLRDHVHRWQQWNHVYYGLFATLCYPDPPDAGERFARLKAVRDQELAKLPAVPPLSDVERSLLEEHEKSWLGPLPDLLFDWPNRRIYRRGFVEHVELTAEDLLRHGADVLRYCPALRSLELIEVKDQVANLASHAEVARVAELHLSTRSAMNRTYEHWHRFYNYRFFGRESDWPALLGWPHRRQTLFLREGDEGPYADACFRTLAASPVLAQIAALDVVWEDSDTTILAEQPARERQLNAILRKPIVRVSIWDMG